MAAARTVIIAGAGIGGLTTALALAQRGFEVTVLEAADRLEEVGAGLQLSPNAARVLISLGVAERLKPHVVVPATRRRAGALAANRSAPPARNATRPCGDPSRRSAGCARDRGGNAGHHVTARQG